MYGEWWEKHAHADITVTHCGFQVQYWDKFQHLDRSVENVLKVVSVLFVARTPSKSTTNGGNWHTSTVQLHGGVPYRLSGSDVSYVSLADVMKAWECTTTSNPHVHKVWRSWSLPFLIYKSKNASFYTCNTVVLCTRLIWTDLPMLLQAHERGYVYDTPDARVEHVWA